jgi:PAS domain S-box-containing protein
MSGEQNERDSFTVDATDAKPAEQWWQESEHQYRAMLEALPVAIYITDSAGRLTFYNEAAVEFSGRRPKLGMDRWCVTWRLYKVDGTPLPHEECPMAIALKEDRPIRGVEMIAERPDGTRVPIMPFPTPLHNEAGELIGAINLLVDLTEVYQAEADRARLAAIVDSSDDAIISKTLDGRITSWNKGATRIFGFEAEEMIGQPITRIVPAELQGEEREILARLRNGERFEHYETIRVAKDGRRVDVSLTVSPVRDRAGTVIGASKVARDISERRQSEKMRQLLLDELNHRVKNTLASVQAIVQHTLRQTRDPVAFATSFAGRIQSLARVHSLLTSSTWQGADLRELVRDQLLLGPVDENRVTAWGPTVRLEPQMTVHLALMLHELGTNSAKYGALSVPQGSVTVTWTVNDAILHLQWKERGGPAVAAPRTRGFGITLIEQSAKSEGGNARMHCEAIGITWNISMPLPMSPEASAAWPQAAAMVSPKAAPQSTVTEFKARPKLSGRQLLVVEDEPLVALDIAGGLKDAGAEVVGPTGMEIEALQIIESTALDAAVLDASLHGRPVDKIAAALTKRNIPFVFVTGYGRDALPPAFAKGLLVSKPFSHQQLAEAVGQLFRQGGTITKLKQ